MVLVVDGTQPVGFLSSDQLLRSFEPVGSAESRGNVGIRLVLDIARVLYVLVFEVCNGLFVDLAELLGQGLQFLSLLVLQALLQVLLVLLTDDIEDHRRDGRRDVLPQRRLRTPHLGFSHGRFLDLGLRVWEIYRHVVPCELDALVLGYLVSDPLRQNLVLVIVELVLFEAQQIDVAVSGAGLSGEEVVATSARLPCLA